MKTLSTFAVMATLTSTVALAQTIQFSGLPTGAPPSGWTATQTGDGNAKWEVVPDDSAPNQRKVLKQSGAAAYPVCIKNGTSLKDGFVEVKFKPVSGQEDQAGGIIWRCKDENNYYIARANANEDNICIYYTVDGNPVEKKRANMKVASGQWHRLRVDFSGSHFTVTFDGKKALDGDDETFKNAGKVGVWTQADSTTLFDEFTYGVKQSSTDNTANSAPNGTSYASMAGDSLKLVATGDMQGAWTTMKQVESQWDAESTDLRAANPTLWRSIDSQMDRAIAALRSGNAQQANDELNNYLQVLSSASGQ